LSKNKPRRDGQQLDAWQEEEVKEGNEKQPMVMQLKNKPRQEGCQSVSW